MDYLVSRGDVKWLEQLFLNSPLYRNLPSDPSTVDPTRSSQVDAKIILAH
jgi:hypothetical protein